MANLEGVCRFPLLHFVTDNLPSSTKAPELDDTNAALALKNDGGTTDHSVGAGVSAEQMGIYLAYLVALGFLPKPQRKGDVEIPRYELSEQERAGLMAVGGRGGGGGGGGGAA